MNDTDSDPVLESAKAKLLEAQNEARGWEDFISRYRRLAVSAVRAAQGNQEKFTERKTSGAVPSEEVAHSLAVAKKIILELGRPVRTPELERELRNRGVVIDTDQPTRTLDSRIRYSKLFVNNDRKGWTVIPSTATVNGSAAGIHETPAAQEDRP
jgi:hypothetical protein